MHIALVEPYLGGSHAQWADGLRRHSRHAVCLLGMPARHWKWRMHGAALHMAERILALESPPEALLATDMVDLSSLLALLGRRLPPMPAILYMHENQLTYPWSAADEDPRRGRNLQYAFINLVSAACADRVIFNSEFHRQEFLQAIHPFLRRFPDFRPHGLDERIATRSEVIPPGLDLEGLLSANTGIEKPGQAVILWNHRWEYDKDPDTFFHILRQVKDRGIPFKLIVLGRSYARQPAIFGQLREWFAEELLHLGYAEDRQAYARWLWLADIAPVTSRQDFFGISALEAVACNCYPLWPSRLAFPEHLPEAERSTHLYDDEKALLEKLCRAIEGVDRLRRRSFTHFARPYDWRTLTERYDRLLSTICPPTDDGIDA